ncbi:MmcQ/YjbR family DNA-binding protein [Streptacidiphilus monticola]|jgi:predicted DNA-binding protein (MmcQ/YjbR family)|uniref:MmcQ/YjbR family DNA-binding protein n=1 Tax=Streptacidiphilus monticola TaxID=2161674 RepID=A0ABW1GAZ5_9ACTN
MTPEELRALCLEFNGAEETFPFGPDTAVFKVGGKMFALSALDPGRLQVNLKCEPDRAVELRKAYPAIVPGWHMDKRHWNTVSLDGTLPDDLVRELVEDSYDLVVAKLPRREQLALDWPGVGRVP